jgi:hypothetical protein
MGCNEEPSPGVADAESTSGQIEVSLTTLGDEGKEYRLSPASFTVQCGSEPAITIDASADARTVNVDVQPGACDVTLQPGWQLNRVAADDSLTPVPATLVSETVQHVSVLEFTTAPVNYAFRLGKSALAIGISVNEYPLTHNSGRITSVGTGLYRVQFDHGGEACCFASVAEALAAYPGFDLKTM